MTETLTHSLLELFNCVLVGDSHEKLNVNLKRTMTKGYILDSSASVYLKDKVIMDIIDSVVGLTAEQSNSTFHKSWGKIVNTPNEQLVLEQCLHYLTTYGFESLGFYDEGSVYFPSEKLDIPCINEDIKLTLIKGLTKGEILDLVLKLGSGIALKKETLDRLEFIIKEMGWGFNSLKVIKNKELLSRLYAFYGIVPEDPTEFLRLLVERMTGESLLIKNRELIQKIKNVDSKLHKEALTYYIKNAPDNLSSIFFRYKPLFLALKSISSNKKFFNRLRKDANKTHKPLSVDVASSLTQSLAKGILPSDLGDKIKDINIYRKIRLLNALNFRKTGCKSILYTIRNGKGYAKDFSFKASKSLDQSIEIVKDSIKSDIQPLVEGNTYLIPEGIKYALPTSEKQFMGNMPVGSSIETEGDVLLGIHWENNNERVDLDLSLVKHSGKIGWDGDYSDGDTLFSGDVTDAPKSRGGASEFFWIAEDSKNTYLLCVNDYTYNADNCKVIVASHKGEKLTSNFMVNPNNILLKTNKDITRPQSLLGVFCDKVFYFCDVSVGTGVSACPNENMNHSREFLKHSLKSRQDLEEILLLCGANVTRTHLEDEEYIDLSPDSLNKTTIINLLNE